MCWRAYSSDLGCCLVEERKHLVLATCLLDNKLLGNDLLIKNVLSRC
jgi:hypothetical protein